MLYVAVHTHPASQCPLNSAEGKAMIKQLFSDANVKRGNVKIDDAYMSCPKETRADHKGFFVVEAANPAVVTSFFGPMTVEVREVLPFSEVAKML